jgi:hypothetical protein
VHMPHELVTVLGITQNLGRTLIKVKWPAGGESILLNDDIEAAPAVVAGRCPEVGGSRQL